MLNASGQCPDGVAAGDRAICECYQLQKQHRNGSVQFTQTASPSCVPCPDGAVCPGPRVHWCASNHQPAANGFGCEPCPAGQTSPGGSATDPNGGSCAVSTCQPGYYLPSGTTTCVECPANHYCPGGTAPQAACPSGTTAPAGSSSASACVHPPPPSPPVCSQGQYLDPSDNTCQRPSTPGGGGSTPGGGGSTPGGGGGGPAPAPRPTPGSFTPSGKYALCCITGAYGQGGNATAPASSVRIWSSNEAAQEHSTDPTEIVQQGGTGGCGTYDVSVYSKVHEVAQEWLDARGTACEWSNPCVCVGTVIQSEPWCSASLHTKDGGPSTNCSFCTGLPAHTGGGLTLGHGGGVHPMVIAHDGAAAEPSGGLPPRPTNC